MPNNIHRWQYQYLGAETFPKTISTVEFDAFFRFSEEETAALQARFRKSGLRIAAAIQLGFLRMTGSPLESTQVIPAKLLRYVASQLGVPALTIASLRALYQREKTRYEQQWWAMEVLGFSRATPEQQSALLPYLRQEAKTTISIDQLVERGKLWIYQHRFIAVADRVIRDMARRAMSESEEGILRLIREQMPAHSFSRLESSVLKTYADTGQSVLEWLQQPPRKRSVRAIRERLGRVDLLKGLGIHELNLDFMPIEKIRAYATELYNLRPAKYRELKDPTRSLRLICFLKLALMQATDAAVMLGGRQINKIVRKAYDKARLLEADAVISAARLLQEIRRQVDDDATSDADFRGYVRSLLSEHKAPQFPTRAAAARWILSDPNYRPNHILRSLLSELQKLDLDAEPENPTKERADYLSTLYQQNITSLPKTSEVNVPGPWQDIIEGDDRVRAMRGLEAATLIGLRKSLRSGGVYVDHSEKFRGRHRLMIDPQRWQKERAKRYAQLNLPLTATDLLDTLVAELEGKLAALDTAIAKGEIHIENGTIRTPRVNALEKAPEVEQKKNELFRKIGTVQLPDLILEMDHRTGFSKILFGRAARDPNELLQVYAGMLAHGSALDASTVSLMVPQLTPNQILAGMRYFEDRDVVRAANDAVMGFQRQLRIASHWGDGSLVSADMMSMDVSRKIWLARLDPKRGIPSVGTYTHYSDFWSIIYDQPIVLNERQAGAAIEGAVRQREVEIERLAVDTHGYTEFAMAIAKLLGFALCPRLKRLSERKLYVPSRMKNIPESLKDIVIPSISLKKVGEDWDNMVRLAASIETGHTTATVALARFGSASSDSPLYRAGVHLGRLIRSLYLCDYFLSEDLRRLINRILVHGEAVHTLQRAINAGTFSKPRGQREEELYAVSGSLTLLTNLCLAWTASKMQDGVFGEGGMAESGDGLDWLQAVSPAHYSNINFRGTFTFAIGKYQEWLLPNVATRRSSQ